MSDTPPPPARRQLSSLTDEEAAEVYRLAFPGRQATKVTWIGDTVLYVNPDDVSLRIERDGDVSTMSAQDADYSVAFDAVAVVRFLDGLGIDLG